MSHIVTCKSCANRFSGAYCNVCGEKVINDDDRKLKHFLGEFINAITFADNKLWRTLKNIIISPGRYSLDFVEGKRRGYMKPISMFFLANLLYFLIPHFNTSLNIQTNDFLHSNVAEKLVQQEVAERGISLENYQSQYDTKTTELSKLLLIMMAIIIAIIFWIIHLGSRHNLIADNLTVGLEFMTFIIIYGTLSTSAILYLLSFFGLNLLSDAIMSSLNLILLTYFIARTEYTFYGFRKLRLVLNTFFSLTAIVISLYMYRAFLFFATFWSI